MSLVDCLIRSLSSSYPEHVLDIARLHADQNQRCRHPATAGLRLQFQCVVAGVCTLLGVF